MTFSYGHEEGPLEIDLDLAEEEMSDFLMGFRPIRLRLFDHHYAVLHFSEEESLTIAPEPLRKEGTA